MKTTYLRASTATEVWACLTMLRAKTAVVDIEPFVAFWDTDQTILEEGIATILDSVADAGLDAVLFATNSTRRLPTPPTATWARIGYLASAGKPLRMAAYRDLPRPGVVIGDQVATDGVLAWRLGYAFVHYAPGLATTPLGPRVMGQIGRPIRPLLFRRAGFPRPG